MNSLPTPKTSFPNPLQRPATRRHFSSGRLLMMNLVMLMGVFGVYVFVLPLFLGILTDAHVQLPELTRWVLSLPSTRVQLFLELFFALLIAKELAVPSPAVKLAANLVAWLISAALLITLMLALVLPIRQLFQTFYPQ